MLNGLNGALATGALMNGVVVISCCSDLRLFPSSNFRSTFLCFFLIRWRLDCTPQHSLNSSASTVDGPLVIQAIVKMIKFTSTLLINHIRQIPAR